MKNEKAAVKVAYQNKDISSKYLASMHGEAFAKTLGLDIAPIAQNEPTELPAVEVTDMMMDNLFLLVMAALSVKGKEQKLRIIERCVDILEAIKDESLQRSLYGGLIAFTDKVIEADTLEEIRRKLTMTKIEKMFYDEKMGAVNEAMTESAEAIAANLIRDGADVDFVSRNTGLDLSVVEGIADRIARENNKEVAMA